MKSQISVLRSKVEHQQREIQQNSRKQQNNNNNQTQSNMMNRTLLDDDKALEIIELTLYKYQGFLDFLRNAGFGKLIEMGDMNQRQQQQQQQQQKNMLANNEQKMRQQQQLTKSKSKSNSSSSKRQTLSPSKLSDQQKYYLEKINKTKSKMYKNSLESTKNSSTLIEPRETRFAMVDSIVSYDPIDRSVKTL